MSKFGKTFAALSILGTSIAGSLLVENNYQKDAMVDVNRIIQASEKNNQFKRIKQISNGEFISFALMNDGFSNRLFVWGKNQSGMFGTPESTIEKNSKPTEVNFNLGNNIQIKEILTKGKNVGVIANDGEQDHLFLWGGNPYGQIGNGSVGNNFYTPVEVNFRTSKRLELRNLDFGQNNVGVVANDGDKDYLYAWGKNDQGQIGNTSKVDVILPLSVNIDSGEEGIEGKIVDFALGYYHGGIVIDANGDQELYTWGYNKNGQLGNGSTSGRSTPVEINVDGGDKGIQGEAVALSFGAQYSGLVINDGLKEHLYTWGNNEYGELGNQKYGGEAKWPINIDLLNYIITKPIVKTLKVEAKSNKSVSVDWDVMDLDNAVTSIKVLDSNNTLYDMGDQTSGTAVINGLYSDTSYTDWKLEIQWGNEFVGYNTISIKINEFKMGLFNSKLVILIAIPVVTFLFLLILLVLLLIKRSNKKVEYNVYQQVPPNYQSYEGNYL